MMLFNVPGARLLLTFIGKNIKSLLGQQRWNFDDRLAFLNKICAD